VLTDHAAREGGGGGAIADPKAAERGSRYAVKTFSTKYAAVARLAGRRGGKRSRPSGVSLAPRLWTTLHRVSCVRAGVQCQLKECLYPTQHHGCTQQHCYGAALDQM
jgi:hypothetical protein